MPLTVFLNNANMSGQYHSRACYHHAFPLQSPVAPFSGQTAVWHLWVSISGSHLCSTSTPPDCSVSALLDTYGMPIKAAVGPLQAPITFEL